MDTETGQGFIKQRRNLISISLVLFFYQVLGVEIKILNIFGTTVEIQKSPYIALILWIVCVYFLLRYYQYYKHINIGEVEDGIHSRMKRHVSKIAFKIFKKTYDLSKNASGIPNFQSLKAIQKSTEGWNVNLNIIITSGELADRTSHSNIQSHIIHVKRKNLIWPFLKSYINLTFTTRFVTEYYLPFLLALIPIVYQIYQWTYILINLK